MLEKLRFVTWLTVFLIVMGWTALSFTTIVGAGALAIINFRLEMVMWYEPILWMFGGTISLFASLISAAAFINEVS